MSPRNETVTTVQGPNQAENEMVPLTRQIAIILLPPLPFGHLHRFLSPFLSDTNACFFLTVLPSPPLSEGFQYGFNPASLLHVGPESSGRGG
jgi:hypothetical protein